MINTKRQIEMSDCLRVPYNNEESYLDKVEKQALFEALFQTKVWGASYIKNPFIYVTEI